MDVSVNAPFKKRVTDLWIEWGQAAYLKQPSRQHVMNWLSTAWEELSEDILYCSFPKCGISNALDDSKDNAILCRHTCGDICEDLNQDDCLEYDVDKLDQFSDD